MIYKPADYFQPLDLAQIFSAPDRPLEVELGAGDGSFLARYAARHLGRNFIGVERLLGRLRKLDRKGLRAGLANLRLLRIEAGYFLDYLLPRQSADAVHLYFPDPWPKRRHWKRRLVNSEFPERARRALKPGGRIFLRTDSAEYFEQMQRVFAEAPDFFEQETPAELLELKTDFEVDFNQRGLATRRLCFQARAEG